MDEVIILRLVQTLALIGVGGFLFAFGSIFYGAAEKTMYRGIMVGCMAIAAAFVIKGESSDDPIVNFIILFGASAGFYHFGRLAARSIFKGSKSDFKITGRFILKHIVAPLVVSLILFIITGSTSLSLFTMPILGILSVSVNLA